MSGEGRETEVRARPGVVEIALPESPTTGYLWRLVDPPAAVREVGREFRGSEGARLGGGGTRVFRLRVDEPGRYALDFRLQRPWEEEVAERRPTTLVVEG